MQRLKLFLLSIISVFFICRLVRVSNPSRFLLIAGSAQSKSRTIYEAIDRLDFDQIPDFIAKHLVQNKVLNCSMHPLHYALNKHGNNEQLLKLVKMLLKGGLDANAKGCRWTALHQAIHLQHEDVVAHLLKCGAHVNACDQEGRTPLHHACLVGFKGGIKQLLVNGAALNAKDKKGNRPIHLLCGKGRGFWCCQSNYCSMVECMRNFGADINATDDKGRTALHIAAKKGNEQITHCLLKNGANVNILDKKNASPLHYACGKSPSIWSKKIQYYHVQQGLVAHKANINSIDNRGKTPLHYASACGHAKGVAWLIEHGAHIDLKDHEGATPLHYAFGKDAKRFKPFKYDEYVRTHYQMKTFERRYKRNLKAHCTIVALLLNRGANQKIKDYFLRIPYFYAVRHKHQQITTLFSHPEGKENVTVTWIKK